MDARKYYIGHIPGLQKAVKALMGILPTAKTGRKLMAQAAPMLRLIDDVFEKHELQRKDIKRVVLNFENYE